MAFIQRLDWLARDDVTKFRPIVYTFIVSCSVPDLQINLKSTDFF